MAISEQEKTARACLEEICKLVPDAGNPEALIGDLVIDGPARVQDVLTSLRLKPEWRDDVGADELATHFGSPVVLQLKNDNWVIFLGCRRGAEGEEEHYAVFDPLSRESGKVIFLKRVALEKAWAGKAVFLKNFANQHYAADGRHTFLYCLVSICRHHNLDADVRRLLHEYAVEEEPSINLLRKMADDLGLTTRCGKLKWSALEEREHIYPSIAIKKDGKGAVLCGMREMAAPPGQPELTDPPSLIGVWDPVPPAQGRAPEIQWLTQEQYEEQFSGELVLCKRVFSLLDEERPFGLLWFIPEFVRQKKLLAEVATAVLAISAIGLVTPLFFQLVVDKVLVHESYTTLTVLGVAVCVALLFNALLEFLQNYLLIYATNRIDIRLATKTFRKLLNLPVDFYERISSGVLIKHMQQTEKIRQFLSGSLFFSLLELISLLVFLPVLFWYSTKLTFVVLLFTFLMALVIATLIKPFQRRLEELYQAEGRRQGMLVETIHGVRTVKSLALEPVLQRKWNDTAAFAISRYFNVAKISMTARTLSHWLERLMGVCIIWVGALAVFDGEISVGALIAFNMLAGRVTGPLVRIVGLVHEYQQTSLSVRMLGVVMNARDEQVGGGIRQPLRGEISFENIRFQYLPDAPPAIRDFSYRIQPGTTVGLVGRSGSGKTTVTKLMQGLYPLQQGVIKYDGIDLREIDRAHLRSHIGVVLQDNYFFHGTIRENLTLTKKDATMEEVIYAARVAGAEEFIQNLPRGYDSMLEENASNLSGGQRQRLAIARALLPNPRILIFDEATSALDPESETLIRRNLKQIARNRTVFIISHRLSILCRADDIIVLEKGSILEHGTHRQLVAAGGLYADFWQQQMGTEDD
ncbi:MAG: peptidase domain-containing ABC transporter [Akkermansia sp.]|nr:peptidase domain-containing ABC transporter [Akkermansia sp.]